MISQLKGRKCFWETPPVLGAGRGRTCDGHTSTSSGSFSDFPPEMSPIRSCWLRVVTATSSFSVRVCLGQVMFGSGHIFMFGSGQPLFQPRNKSMSESYLLSKKGRDSFERCGSGCFAQALCNHFCTPPTPPTRTPITLPHPHPIQTKRTANTTRSIEKLTSGCSRQYIFILCVFRSCAARFDAEIGLDAMEALR